MTLNYAKYVSEDTIIRPRKNIKTPHLVAFNFDKNEALLKQEGYLPLVEDEKPEEMAQGYHLEPRYSLNEGSHFETRDILDEEGAVVGQKSVEVDDSFIRVSWVAVEDVVEETDD